MNDTLTNIRYKGHRQKGETVKKFLDIDETRDYICENYIMKLICRYSHMSQTKDKIIRIALRKHLIKEAGLQYQDFGRVELVYQVVNELRPGKKLRRKIARKLKMPMSEVWPDSNIRGNRRKRNTRAGRHSSRIKTAA